jgi:hypothetical protein
MRYFFEHIFIKKNFRKKLAENFLGSGSGSGTGSGSGRFRKSDPDPVKNRPDPQPWLQHPCHPANSHFPLVMHPLSIPKYSRILGKNTLRYTGCNG